MGLWGWVKEHPGELAVAGIATVATLPFGGEGGLAVLAAEEGGEIAAEQGGMAAARAAAPAAEAAGRSVMSGAGMAFSFLRSGAARLVGAGGRLLGGVGKKGGEAVLENEAAEGIDRAERGIFGKLGRGAGRASRGFGRVAKGAGEGALGMVGGSIGSFLGGAVGNGLIGGGLTIVALMEAIDFARGWIASKFFGANAMRADTLQNAMAAHAQAAGANINGIAGSEVQSLKAGAQGLTPEKIQAYGLNQPPGKIDPNQVASMSVMKDGRQMTLPLPFMRGKNDAETLQRSTEYWNSQAQLGKVPPLSDGMTLSIGDKAAQRDYTLSDGSWHNVGPSAYANLDIFGRSGLRGTEIAPSNVNLGAVMPGLGAAGVLAAGAGTDAASLTQGRGGRVFANLDPNGAWRLTAMNGDPTKFGETLSSSMSVDAKRGGSVVAGREVLSERGLFRKDAAVTLGDSLQVGKDGLIHGDANVQRRMGEAAQLVRKNDDLDRALQGSQLHGFDARVAHVRGLDNSDGLGGGVVASLNGQGPDGRTQRAMMMIQNGKANLAIYSGSSRIPSWSSEVSDKGFSVGKDGSVSLSGRANEIVTNFANNPRAEAAALQGPAKQNGALAAFAKMTSDQGFSATQAMFGRQGMAPGAAAGLSR